MNEELLKKIEKEQLLLKRRRDFVKENFSNEITRHEKVLSLYKDNIKAYDDVSFEVENISNYLKISETKDVSDITSISVDIEASAKNKIILKSNEISKADKFTIKWIGSNLVLNIYLYYNMQINSTVYKVVCFDGNVLSRLRGSEHKFLKFKNLNDKISEKFHSSYKEKVLNYYSENTDWFKLDKESEFYNEYLELKKFEIFK